ncbi:MAG: hypothetical protein C0600_16195 [Ignavibacteria bacterium]|nr:MAG: hypothetical protein C0600_16195 [Ignavibacteria bacterium]
MLRYHSSMLVPLDGTNPGRCEGADRLIPFSGSLSQLLNGALPLHFLATLGDRDSIPLLLDEFEWLDAPVDVTVIDGSLRLDICREGGARLFDAEGQVRLMQNRPNPFNSTTQIDVELIESGTTELFILNSLGQRVRTLLSGHQDAGRISVTFDAGDLPSGTYICTLHTPSVLLRRVMVLVK